MDLAVCSQACSGQPGELQEDMPAPRAGQDGRTAWHGVCFAGQTELLTCLGGEGQGDTVWPPLPGAASAGREELANTPPGRLPQRMLSISVAVLSYTGQLPNAGTTSGHDFTVLLLQGALTQDICEATATGWEAAKDA